LGIIGKRQDRQRHTRRRIGEETIDRDDAERGEEDERQIEEVRGHECRTPERIGAAACGGAHDFNTRTSAAAALTTTLWPTASAFVRKLVLAVATSSRPAPKRSDSERSSPR